MGVLDTLLSGKKVEIPVEGEQFPSFGFIGPVKAKMLWQFWSQLDFSGPEYREDVPQPFYRDQFPNGGFRYYYLDPETGAQAAKIDQSAFNPQQVWFYSMPVTDIMNMDTSNFQSNNINRSCRVTTLRSQYRHEFHMITLPAIVRAVAVNAGFSVPEYDLRELLVRDPIITDEVSRRLIGSAPKHTDYEESELWRKRAELWKALGENDPKKYLVDTVKPNGTPHEGNTEAEKLQACLRIYTEEWEDRPLWCRFQMVADPRAAAVSSSGKRLSLPAVTEIFSGETDAQKAIDNDLSDMVSNAVGGSASEQASKSASGSASGKPALPTAWADAGEEKWRVQVLPFTTEPKAIVKSKYDPDDYGASFEELWAWVEWEKKIG